ncbi:hypothetical protein PPERSA_12197 [Pseudocohnilembus persalinus]|uniref:DUF541 domain-containing protein n=1 Tax=Pseudocohnilembus persalinus TaxID=266149 RepID=A0A0V0R8Q2_PSEPJ|nr:hypothetical protein PPERSA_12197 [Pseudocohnilembus persalinus]|eukprot:KRX10846.1 hypothetical protein PPERSA_12197 [Pseudocohnilembus persalinus]
MNKILAIIIFVLAINISQQIHRSGDICDTYYLPDPFYISGSASATLQAEVVQISFSVETLEKEAYDSSQENAKIVNFVIMELQNQLEIKKKEISTKNYSISAYYEYNRNTGKSEFKGYKTNNSIVVKTDQIEKAGKIIDLAISEGVTNIQSINYDAKPETKKQMKDKLITVAIDDAKNQAKIAVEALEYELIGVKNVSVQSNNPPVMYKEQNASASLYDSEEGYDTQVFSGDLVISQTVNVGFLISAKI